MTRISAPRQKTPFSRFIVPLITMGILALLWYGDLFWGIIPIIAFLIFYSFMIPSISRTLTVRFNRKAIQLLTHKKAAEMPNLIRKSFFFRLIAPKGVLESKMALAYLECEQFPLALRSFEASMPYVDAAERPALLVGLVKALFVTGDFEQAEAQGMDAIQNITTLPELFTLTARARLGLGKNNDETKRMLDDAEKLSPSRDVRLMIDLTRIEAALLAGRKAPELKEDADSHRKLVRAWIHLVRGLLREHRGDMEKAASSFEKARTVLPESFIAAEAAKHLSAVAEKSAALSSDAKKGGGMNTPSRKKKKKRR